MMKKNTNIRTIIWYCVAALIWGILLFILITQISEWPRSKKSLQLIYEQAVVNPEWSHTIQGDPLSSMLKGILGRVLILEPIVFGTALLGLLFFTVSAMHWRRRYRDMIESKKEES
jgi:hypothetical protein